MIVLLILMSVSKGGGTSIIKDNKIGITNFESSFYIF